MLINYEIEQGTDAWLELRAGKFSASNASIFVGDVKNKGFTDLIKTAAWGRAFGAANEPTYKSASMLRGNELEPEARNWYIFNQGVLVREAGFVQRQDAPHCGWSPDGLVFQDGALVGGIEIKCLEHKAFMDVLADEKIPSVYIYQCQWAIWIGRLEWLDFVAYHPQFGGIVIRCHADSDIISRFEQRLPVAEKMVDDWLVKLGKKQEFEITF